MSRQILCLFALAFVLSACSGDEPPAAGDTEAPTGSEAEAASPNLERDTGLIVDEAFLHHMHAHAEMLDEINYALADGNLELAITPAYWLARHHEFEGMPDEWRPYAKGMREAAAAVESAPDLETARAAAERITEQCVACHTAAGMNVENN